MATANAIHAAYDQRLAGLGLTLSTASLLAYLAEFGPVTQTRCAEHLGQGRAVTGTQVDKLESLGCVERRPDPADRRVWLVAITEQGRSLADRVAEVDEGLRGEFREGISRSDRQTLAALLVRLQENIHRSQLVAASQRPSSQQPSAQQPSAQQPSAQQPSAQQPSAQQ
ncbi:MAG: hypothetical protein CL424_03450, partial [Acidimicrobiaceae bacterium]|nr:hypothetical protein [Acidimicrobiaceae bacterium]